MRIRLVITGIVACATLASVGGCKKEEPVSSPVDQKTRESVTPQTEKAVAGAASEVKQATETVAAGVTQALQAAVSEKKPAEAVTLTDADVAQTQGLIDRAKGYVADKKYQEALDTIKQLAGAKQTPEQQKLVEDLKAQIQSALAKAAGSDAASALGGALGGKK
jgi:thioredoxin-like negative regulator of GroEL